MESEYRIALHGRSPTGLEVYGEFYIGNSHTEAIRLFQMLKGHPERIKEGILFMELRCNSRGLPSDIKMKSCTLEEVTENCKIITKYLFLARGLNALF